MFPMLNENRAVVVGNAFWAGGVAIKETTKLIFEREFKITGTTKIQFPEVKCWGSLGRQVCIMVKGTLITQSTAHVMSPLYKLNENGVTSL